MNLPFDVFATLLKTVEKPLKPWVKDRRLSILRVSSIALRAVRTKNLVILRMGLGRDSVAMLLLLLEGKIKIDGRVLQPSDVDAVVFTDPGAEWANTYELIPKIADLCEKNGIRFIVQAKPPEEVWRPFVEERTARRSLLRAEAPKMIYEAIARRKRATRSQRKGSVVYRSDDPSERLYVGQIAAGTKGYAVVRPGHSGGLPTVLEKGLTEAEAKKIAKKTLEIRDVKLPAEKRPWQERIPGETIESKAARGAYHERAPIMAEYAGRQALVKRTDSSCSIVHKITPMYRLLADMQVERFGELPKVKGSKVRDPYFIQLDAWSEAGNPAHILLIGIADDERERASPCEGAHPWERAVYPLIDLGIAKADEAPILNRYGFGGVKKSGCVMCKFQPIAWYWALSVVSPDKFAEVIAYERQALTMSPNNLIADRGVEPQDGWRGDSLRRRGLTIDRAVQIWAEANLPENPTQKQIDDTVEAVLSKAYKRCDRADGSLVKAAEPQPPPDAPKANPRREDWSQAFADDVDRLMDTLAADGFTLSRFAE